MCPALEQSSAVFCAHKKGVSIPSKPPRRSSTRRHGARRHRAIDNYFELLREGRRSADRRWDLYFGIIDLNHMRRKREMGAQASTFGGYCKLAGAYLLDVFKAAALMAFFRLLILLSVIAGWLLLGLFIWFILFY